MSYCRASKDSDVYVIRTSGEGGPYWLCHCQQPAYAVDRREDMLEHLREHRANGDKVPDHAIERLKTEIAAG